MAVWVKEAVEFPKAEHTIKTAINMTMRVICFWNWFVGGWGGES